MSMILFERKPNTDDFPQGPPPPMPQLQGVQGQHLRVQEIRDGK